MAANRNILRFRFGMYERVHLRFGLNFPVFAHVSFLIETTIA